MKTVPIVLYRRAVRYIILQEVEAACFISF